VAFLVETANHAERRSPRRVQVATYTEKPEIIEPHVSDVRLVVAWGWKR
jgi:hypothetical protein